VQDSGFKSVPAAVNDAAPANKNFERCIKLFTLYEGLFFY